MNNISPMTRRPEDFRWPRLLAVEDDANFAELLRHAIERIDPRIALHLANNARQAIELLTAEKAEAPDLIITDLNMPGMNGFELLEWLKTRSRHYRTPVIMLSSSNEEKDAARAYDLGAAAYLVKPMTFDSLLTTLKGTLAFWSLVAVPPVAPKGRPGIETGLAWL